MQSLTVPIDRSNLAHKQRMYAAELEAEKILLLDDLAFTPSAEELKLFRGCLPIPPEPRRAITAPVLEREPE